MTTSVPPASAASLHLTELTSCGGCAAKLGADVLAEALAGLGAEAAPDDLLVGLGSPDDAAVYRVSDDLAIVGTLDFFPPLVDDPATYGAIAAANALSDVFALGGRVLFALSIAAFPEELPRETMAAIFAGASATVREAGGVLAGGHTIRDPEPKYGLAAGGAAATDGTGVGLRGHATEMARGSGCRLVLGSGSLPALDGALELAAAGVETDGAAGNRRFAAPTLEIAADVPGDREALAFDPQTSGGLLAAVPNDRPATVIAGFGAAGVAWWRVGHVESGDGVHLVA